MQTEVQVLPLFYKNLEADSRIVINQGSSRSGKTYSIVQMLIYVATNESVKVSIIRKESTTLRNTILQDFKQIMIDWGLWDTAGVFNKVLMEYNFHNGSVVEFLGANDEQKLRGAKRDIAFIDEANELGYESVKQIMMRTTRQIYLSYNPSITRLHWLYSKMIDVRDDITFFHSTYKDNTFLEREIIDEIEALQFTDPDAWRVFGLGEMGVSTSTIFPLAKEYDVLPQDVSVLSYGLDFGYTADPTALIRAYISNDSKRIYLEELAYSTGLTNENIAEILKQHVQTKEIVYADSAEPKSIDYLKSHRLNVRPTKKGRDSIMAGIDTLKQYQIFYKGDNIKQEFFNYRWKEDLNGDITNTPIDRYNHAIDAVRYATFNILGKKKGNIRFI